MERRRTLSYAALSKLTALGYTNEFISPQMKARLFVAFIRSILNYGIENCNLNCNQIDMFKTSEGNIIKKMLYLPSGSKTTELLNSFNLDTTINHVRNQKLCFYLQLRKNSYTNEILTQITKMNNSINFVHEIRCLLNSNSSTSMETLDDRATMEIREMKHQVGKSKEKSKQILSLLKAYEISSPKNRTYQIRTILMTYNQSECVHPSNRSIKY